MTDARRSMYRKPRWIAGVCLIALFALGLGGCSGCSETTTGGGDGGGTGADGSADGIATDGYAIDGSAQYCRDLKGCAKDQICGKCCCASNTSCVKGQCLPPCGGTRCGKQNRKCCSGQEVCLYDSCLTPGKACERNRDCPDGKICEPTLEKCVPDPGIDCKYKPGEDVFEPKVDVAWKDGPNTPAPEFNQVMMTPAVADIDESGTPDIVFSTFKGGNYNGASVLRAIDGETYDPIFDLTADEKRVAGSGSLAVGDIDGDGKNEIVGIGPNADGLIAIDDHTTNWAVKWRASGFSMQWDGASLVDLDGDGGVEVVGANRVVDGASGDVLCTGEGVVPNPKNSTAIDLDGDGDQEVLGSNGAFDFEADGSGGYNCPSLFTYASDAGYPAVGDFGTFGGGAEQFGKLDGTPEIALVVPEAGGTVQLRNGQNGETIWSSSIPNDNHPHFRKTRCNSVGAGPPTVADFDGDDEPEIATAGACFYAVFETDGTLLWRHPSQDFSSNQTGSSVFDFQGDGKAEAVYADECFIRVYRGAGDGAQGTEVYFKRAHSSGTTRELPVIVDADGDRNTEIVLISNDYSTGTIDNCRANWTQFEDLGGAERGVLVIQDERNRWVSSRPIWNQHAYHVTNVCDGVNDDLCPGRTNVPGAIPKGQKDNWKVDYLNNFRQNVQGEGLFDAPDVLVTDITVSNAECTDEGLTVDVNVEIANRGARAVARGTTVALYAENSAGDRTEIGTVKTTRTLLPGQSERLTSTWQVPATYQSGEVTIEGVADSAEKANECDEENNAGTETFQDLSSLAGTLTFVSYEVDTSQCPVSGKMSVAIELENPGSDVVPKGLPIVVSADNGDQTHTFGTLETDSKLRPGESVSVSGSWKVPLDFVNQEIDVTVRIDPEQTVFACGGGTKTKTVACRLGG